jgi:hypothetical protein
MRAEGSDFVQDQMSLMLRESAERVRGYRGKIAQIQKPTALSEHIRLIHGEAAAVRGH